MADIGQNILVFSQRSGYITKREQVVNKFLILFIGVDYAKE